MGAPCDNTAQSPHVAAFHHTLCPPAVFGPSDARGENLEYGLGQNMPITDFAKLITGRHLAIGNKATGKDWMHYRRAAFGSAFDAGVGALGRQARRRAAWLPGQMTR